MYAACCHAKTIANLDEEKYNIWPRRVRCVCMCDSFSTGESRLCRHALLERNALHRCIAPVADAMRKCTAPVAPCVTSSTKSHMPHQQSSLIFGVIVGSAHCDSGLIQKRMTIERSRRLTAQSLSSSDAMCVPFVLCHLGMSSLRPWR